MTTTEPDTARATRFPRGHCGREGCPCTHSCDHGWLEGKPYTHRGVQYTAPQEPCPICRPEATARLREGSTTVAEPPPPPQPSPPAPSDLPPELWEDQ